MPSTGEESDCGARQLEGSGGRHRGWQASWRPSVALGTASPQPAQMPAWQGRPQIRAALSSPGIHLSVSDPADIKTDLVWAQESRVRAWSLAGYRSHARLRPACEGCQGCPCSGSRVCQRSADRSSAGCPGGKRFGGLACAGPSQLLLAACCQQHAAAIRERQSMPRWLAGDWERRT